MMLACAVIAEPLEVVDLQWALMDARDGDQFEGRIILSAPAPKGGVTVILEPTLKLKMPTTVRVEAGDDYADFKVEIVDNRYASRRRTDTTVTASLKGQEYDFPGPSVSGW